mmetsp:Transcript_43400/g.106174  ORF Transcript_43400/g.106174 Transcript_43400/m.106174 type:complete len:364 (+) Transcript_43400:54-1145(+)
MGRWLTVIPTLCLLGSASAFLPHAPAPLARTGRAAAPLPNRRNSAMAGPPLRMSGSPPKPLEAYRREAVGSNVVGRDSGKVAFPLLDPSRFVHPFDRQATAALASLPFFEDIVRTGFGGMLEQAIYLDNLSNSIRVGPKQLPQIYNSLQEAKMILGLDKVAVDVYVRQNPLPNAFTLAMQGKKPFIVLHSSLIELLSPEEVQAVIAHELGHLKCEHGVWITMANIITNLASQVPGFGRQVAESLNLGTLRWLRAAELSCDRAALLVTQNPRVVVSVIMKLSGGAASFGKDLNPDEFLRQAQDFEQESTNSWMFRRMRDTLTNTLSHPLPVERVRELDRWSKSDEYRSLLAGGDPIKAAVSQAP